MSVAMPHNSLDLMQRNQEIRNHFQDDCFFLTARNFEIGVSGTLEIHIDETCPVLVRDAKVKGLIDAPTDMMTLQEGRSDIMANMGYIALAAGGFVWIGDKMALLQRDAKAPLLAEHWTNPSGMCGEHPFDTADKETSEELKLFSLKQRVLYAFQAAGNTTTETDQAIANLKRRKIIAENTVPEIQYIQLGSSQCIRDNRGTLVQMVIGSDIRTRQIPHIHVDRQNNNLVALNQVFNTAHLSGRDDLVSVDGEVFNRLGDIVSPQEALELRLVPTTRDYLESLSPNF
jgi:hypothetical protein